MLDTMRTALSVTRAERNDRILRGRQLPLHVNPTTLAAFNLATIVGARASGMETHIGSLQVGKKADIVVFRTDTPTMACAAEQDPVAAVVRHAGTREVETVLVDGVIRKHNFELSRVSLREAQHQNVPRWKGNQTRLDGRDLSWEDVLGCLRRSRSHVQKRIDECNIAAAHEMATVRWGLSKTESFAI